MFWHWHVTVKSLYVSLQYVYNYSCALWVLLYLVRVFVEVKVLVKICDKLAVEEVVSSIYCPKAPVRVVGSVGTETKFSP